MKYIKLFENFEQDDLTKEIEDYLGVDLETFGETQKVLALSPEGLQRWFDAEIDKDNPNLRVIAELERLGYNFDILKKDLFYAAENDKVGLALYLLDKGANMNAANIVQQTLLHYAASSDSIRVATLLLDRGYDMEVKDYRQLTALHIAASSDSIRVATLLLDRGAYMEARSEWQETPLHYAVKNRKIRVANLLRSRGATE